MIDSTKMTRRRLLGDTARLTAAAFASTLLPPKGRATGRVLDPRRVLARLAYSTHQAFTAGTFIHGT